MRNLCLVVLIFTITFACIESKDIHRSERHSDYSQFEISECGPLRNQLSSSIRNSTCKPHYKLVPLRSMPGQNFHPAVASVKRCDGDCHGHTCMPTKTQIKKVPVKIYDKNVNSKANGMCALVEVEEHLQCRCMCQQKEDECNEHQIFMKNQCACVCKDQEIKKSECEIQKGMFWNHEKCMCECTYMNMECIPGLKWDRSACACVRS